MDPTSSPRRGHLLHLAIALLAFGALMGGVSALVLLTADEPASSSLIAIRWSMLGIGVVSLVAGALTLALHALAPAVVGAVLVSLTGVAGVAGSIAAGVLPMGPLTLLVVAAFLWVKIVLAARAVA